MFALAAIFLSALGGLSHANPLQVVTPQQTPCRGAAAQFRQALSDRTATALEGLMDIDFTDMNELTYIFCTISENTPEDALALFTASGHVNKVVRYIYGKYAGAALLNRESDPVLFNAFRQIGYFEIDPEAILDYLEIAVGTPRETAEEMLRMESVPRNTSCQVFIDMMRQSNEEAGPYWQRFVSHTQEIYGVDPSDAEAYGNLLCEASGAVSIPAMTEVYNRYGVIAHYFGYVARTGRLLDL